MIGFDSTSQSTASQTTSPFTWSHTCTGSNLLLVVCVDMQGQTQPTTSAVTYNGVSMVKAVGVQNSNAGNFAESSIWFLFAPATGSNTVSVSCTQGSNGGAIASAMSYTQAQQSNTPDSTGTTTSTATGALVTTVNTNARNCWIVCTGTANGSTPGISAATATQRQNGAANGAGVSGNGASQDTNGAKSSGAKTIGFTYAGATAASFTQVAAAFAPITPTFSQNTLRPHPFSPGLAR